MYPECTSPASNIVAEDILTSIRTVGKDVCHRYESSYRTIEKSNNKTPKNHDEEIIRVEKAVNEMLQEASNRLQCSGKVICKRGVAALFLRPKGELGPFQRRTKIVPPDYVRCTQILLTRIRVSRFACPI